MVVGDGHLLIVGRRSRILRIVLAHQVPRKGDTLVLTCSLYRRFRLVFNVQNHLDTVSLPFDG